jgi:hypothetical protein
MTFAAKINRRFVALMLAAVAVLGGVAAGCTNDSGRGMYQGGSDSVPGWR